MHDSTRHATPVPRVAGRACSSLPRPGGATGGARVGPRGEMGPGYAKSKTLYNTLKNLLVPLPSLAPLPLPPRIAAAARTAARVAAASCHCHTTVHRRTAQRRAGTGVVARPSDEGRTRDRDAAGRAREKLPTLRARSIAKERAMVPSTGPLAHIHHAQSTASSSVSPLLGSGVPLLPANRPKGLMRDLRPLKHGPNARR